MIAVEQPGISWPHDSARSDWFVLDLETSGLWPSVDRMVEIGLSRLSPCGDEIGSWTSLVDPNRAIDATEVHGLTAGDLRRAPHLATPLPGFLQFLEPASSATRARARTSSTIHATVVDWRRHRRATPLPVGVR